MKNINILRDNKQVPYQNIMVNGEKFVQNEIQKIQKRVTSQKTNRTSTKGKMDGNKLTKKHENGNDFVKVLNRKAWKICTWNIKSINGKENELTQEFEEAGLEILATS